MEQIGVLKRTDEDVHLCYEAREARKTEVGQAGNNIGNGQERHDLHQSSQATHVTCSATVIDHTDDSKEKGCHQTVREHLQNSTCASSLGHHQQSEKHHAAVRHGRVSIDILQVGLHTSGERTINHRDGGKDEEDPRELVSCLGQQIHGNAEAAITSKFHQHTGVEHRHSRRG